MNSIARLILRRVISGNVTLTPQVLKVLREFDRNLPKTVKPPDAPNKPATPPVQPEPHSPPKESHLIFVNPLPGRWIRRTECGVGGALLLATALARAASQTTAFETANDAFAQGKFSDAARSYESIIAQQGYSAPVLFNLANAQQRGGQLGQAILNYERAKLLAPKDPDIAANLQVARQRAGVAEERQSGAHSAAQLLTLNGWFCFAAMAICLLSVALPLKQLRPRLRRALRWSSMAAALVFAAALSAIVMRWPELHRAVVTAPEAVAGVAPVTMAQPAFKLRAGEVVMWKQTHGEFARIKNHAGHEGWVKASDIARVVGSP